MRYLLAVVLIAIASATYAETMPPIVAKAVNEARASCEGERAKIGPEFLKRQDVNADGISDYILSYEDVRCPSGGRMSCGSAGCLTQIFVSTTQGYIKVLDENVQGIGFRTIRGRPAMQLGLHGSSCGKAGFEECGATLYWNGFKFSPAH